MKKISLYILIFILFVVFGWVKNTSAQHCSVSDYNDSAQTCIDNGGVWSPDSKYQLLAPLGDDMGTEFDPENKNALGEYLNTFIKILIGLSAVMAVVMIVIGGIEYMTSELISSKEDGKHKIRDAILGLFIALGSYALLNTINPDLLKTDIEIGEIAVEVNLIANSIFEKPATAANIARCTPVTSGPCATSNLGIFGARAESMSKICNIESGGNPGAMSGTDKGTDGTVFSFGLLQINLLANGSIVKDSAGNSCGGLFERSDGSPIVGGNYIKKDANGKYVYDAKLKTGMQAKYNDCKNTLLDPAKNIQVAGILYQQGASAFGNPMTAWKGDMGVCSSAFN